MLIFLATDMIQSQTKNIITLAIYTAPCRHIRIDESSGSGFASISIASYFFPIIRMFSAPLLTALIAVAIVARQPSIRFMEALVSLLAGSALAKEPLALGLVSAVGEFRY